MSISSKLTALWHGAAPAASIRKKNVNGTRKYDMAKSDRELGKLEEGLNNIKALLTEQNQSRRQLQDKVDSIDMKVTKMEPRMENMERSIQELKQPVNQYTTQQHEEAGARKFRGFMYFIIGGIVATALQALQFIKHVF